MLFFFTLLHLLKVRSISRCHIPGHHRAGHGREEEKSGCTRASYISYHSFHLNSQEEWDIQTQPSRALTSSKKIPHSKHRPLISQCHSLSRLGDKAEIPDAYSRGTEEVFHGFPPTLQGVKQSLFCLSAAVPPCLRSSSYRVTQHKGNPGSILLSAWLTQLKPPLAPGG